MHYENLKSDLVGQLEIVTTFLNLPFKDADVVGDNKNSRLQCLVKYKDGFFKRNSPTKSQNLYDIEPFPELLRNQMDNVIDYINDNVLKKHGYSEMPLNLYPYYRKVSYRKCRQN